MHKVLVNRLGGLSLPRKSVVRLTDRPDMTLDVYRGRKTTMQQQQPEGIISYNFFSGEPGLVDRVLALHAGSRGLDSHRGHMSERFFRSNRPRYPHPVSSELENSGIRVAVCDCSVTESRRWRPP